VEVSGAAPQIEPQAVTGVVRGLADTLRPNETLLLAVTRLDDDQLLVSIQPPRADKEGAAKSNVPMQVTGTPEEIDTQLVEALAHYVPARKFVIATAEEAARQTAAAAAKEKAEADRRRQERSTGKTSKPTPAPKPKTGELLVGLTPRDATLTVTDHAGKEHPVRRGEIAKLPIGAYTIVASKEGFEEAKRTVTIVEDPKQIVAIELAPTAPTLFA
ncbi:MAG: PRTRC system protein E, partial [Candidatus Baltobacteraceae bacterium]